MEKEIKEEKIASNEKEDKKRRKTKVESKEAIEIGKEEKVESKVVEDKKVERRVRKKIDPNELVAVRSAVEGILVYVSPKTGIKTTWSHLGAEEYLEFGELLTMNASKQKFLTEPWLVIEDQEVIEYFGLQKLYNSILDPEEIDDFLMNTSPKEMREKISLMPKGTRMLLADRARALIQEDKIVDFRVVRLLDEMLNIDLKLLLE